MKTLTLEMLEDEETLNEEVSEKDHKFLDAVRSRVMRNTENDVETEQDLDEDEELMRKSDAFEEEGNDVSILIEHFCESN